MKTCQVKTLMVPLGEYATILESATLLEAINTLKETQAAYNQKRYRHRAILVTDDKRRFVGKLSQHDVIEALEPNYKGMRNALPEGSIHRLGFSDDFVMSTLEQYHLWEKALDNLCAKAISVKVKDVMYSPGKVEFVTEGATLDEAIHRLIIGRHHSLLVTSDRDRTDIVGVLRLTDVFESVSDAMRVCSNNLADHNGL